MSDTTSTPSTPPADPNMTLVLSEMIGQAVAKGLASMLPPKKVTFGQYDPKTSAHPNKAAAVHFAPNRTYMQGGTPLNWAVITDAEATLLNRIHRSGRYIDRFVEVIITEDGLDEVVNIRWAYAKADQRMEAGTKIMSFLHALQQIVSEQDALDAADDEQELERKTRPARRTFGSAKATQDAYAKANA